MARGSAMGCARGRERSRGAQTYTREQAGCDPARSDDAGDGRLCGRCCPAEGDRLAGHPGHRHHGAGSRRQGPRAIECRCPIRAGQGEVPTGRPGRAHPPAGAEDAEKGCEMAAAERPDIILMDLEMPVVDGWEATRRLKGNPQTREIPIIALSAHALAGEREKALAAGCDEFDTKPIEFDRLVATVRRILADRK